MLTVPGVGLTRLLSEGPCSFLQLGSSCSFECVSPALRFRGWGAVGRCPRGWSTHNVLVEPPSSPLPPRGRLPCCLWPFSRGWRVGCWCCSLPFPLDAPGLTSLSRCRCAQLKINILFSTTNFKSEPSLTVQGYQHFLALLSLLSRPQCFVGNGLGDGGVLEMWLHVCTLITVPQPSRAVGYLASLFSINLPSGSCIV